MRGAPVKSEISESLGAAAAKVTPPATVTAASIAGMGLQDWVYTVTIIYTVLMIVQHVVTKWVPLVRSWRARPE